MTQIRNLIGFETASRLDAIKKIERRNTLKKDEKMKKTKKNIQKNINEALRATDKGKGARHKMTKKQAKRNNQLSEGEKKEVLVSYLSGKISESMARSLGLDINGGRVFVGKTMQKEIITYLEEENPIRKLATIHKGKASVGAPIQVKKAEANITKEERDENNLIPFTDIDFEDYYLEPVEFDAIAKVTKKLENMSELEVGKTIVKELSKAYLRKEVEWFIHDKSNPGSLINKAAPFVSHTLITNKYLKLVNAKNAIPTVMRSHASWLINRAAQTELESMLDGNGRPLLKVSPNDDFDFTLLNYPCSVSDHVDDPIDSKKPIIYFGDFTYYHIQDVLEEFEVQILNELFADESKIGYKIYNISDGQLVYGPFENPVLSIEL